MYNITVLIGLVKERLFIYKGRQGVGIGSSEEFNATGFSQIAERSIQFGGNK